MKYTIRSTVLIYLGSMIYGEPSSFGVNCSKEEFYCLPNERTIANHIDFHPLNANRGSNMSRALTIDLARRTAFKHLTIISTVAAIAIFSGGALTTAAIVKSKELVSVAQVRMKTKDAKEIRTFEIQQEAQQLAKDAQSGKISKADYLKKSESLQKEYEQLQEAK